MTAREARRNFAELIRTVQDGRSVTITRRGRPVAQVNPATMPVSGPLPDLTEFRASLKVKGKALSAVITERRRQARY